MAEGLKNKDYVDSSFMMSDEVERLRTALRRRKYVGALITRALIGAVAIWMWLATAEAARHFIPTTWWEKFVKAPVELGISKIK